MSFFIERKSETFWPELFLTLPRFVELLLRNALLWVVFFLSAVAAFVAGLFLPRHVFWERISQGWARTSLWVLNVRVFLNVESRRSSRPSIYIMNHESLIDIFTFCLVAPSNMVFIAKSSIGAVPILGRVMRQAGCVFIDRSNRVEAFSALNAGLKSLPDGASILIFPEGTRSRTGDLLPFKKGFIHLARQGEFDVIPVGQIGASDSLKHRFAWLPFGKFLLAKTSVYINVGNAVPAESLAEGDLNHWIHQFMDMIVALREKGLWQRSQSEHPKCLRSAIRH